MRTPQHAPGSPSGHIPAEEQRDGPVKHDVQSVPHIAQAREVRRSPRHPTLEAGQ